MSDAIEPFHTGGKEARYGALLPRMSEHGIDVHVFTMRWWGAGEPAARSPQGLTLHGLCRRLDLYSGSRRSIRQAVFFALSTVRLVTKRFDVLEADAIPFLPLFPLWLVTRVRRRRMVVTWHEVWGRSYWREYLGTAGIIAAALENLAARLPDHIVAASTGTARRLETELGVPASKITAIPNGVDLQEIDAAPISSDVGDVVCVGRLLSHKNVDVLIDAVAVLRDRGRPTTATVIGSGPEEAALAAQIARLDLQALVTIRPPYTDRHDVLAAMKGASVVAFPTEREGFGMVALEALACATPVVTSNHPDNLARHLVDHGANGHHHSISAPALADALVETLDRADQMAVAARAGAEPYDWDQLAAALAGRLKAEAT